MSAIIQVEGLTNAEFFERHVAPGCIGHFGGPKLINRIVDPAGRQRHLDEEGVCTAS